MPGQNNHNILADKICEELNIQTDNPSRYLEKEGWLKYTTDYVFNYDDKEITDKQLESLRKFLKVPNKLKTEGKIRIGDYRSPHVDISEFDTMDKYSFEITHFRRDIEYTDHRHPKVELVDNFFMDSTRRDFTINALAMDSTGEILDFHDGLKDLQDKVIKTIGDPFLRFTEDALRILRGLYFASKLDFEIESNTLFAMVDKKELLATL